VRVVIALGGNALARRGERASPERQRENVRRAARAVAEIAGGHEVVVTHGNGPQIGQLALQAEAAGGAMAPSLDVLGAETEGMIGYLVDRELSTLLPGRDVATLLTQVEVDPHDPAFAAPDKPIGPVYDEARARALAAERGWRIAADGAGYRRVVASPVPLRIREVRAIELLVQAGVIVVCAGGGGIPVVPTAHGGLRGVEAVVDKDRASALLATALAAEALLMLTDVPCVYADWPAPAQRAIGETTPEALRALAFEPGSMAPKVESACRFVEAGGGVAGIGALEDAAELLRGTRGTRVTRHAHAVAPARSSS
jgi:carbamate kinase